MRYEKSLLSSDDVISDSPVAALMSGVPLTAQRCFALSSKHANAAANSGS